MPRTAVTEFCHDGGGTLVAAAPAIVEEEESKAVGVWFPDLPGCISAGDTLDEALPNAAEAPELWAGAMIESGQEILPPRSLTGLKADPEVAQDLARFMVALIPFPDVLYIPYMRLLLSGGRCEAFAGDS